MAEQMPIVPTDDALQKLTSLVENWCLVDPNHCLLHPQLLDAFKEAMKVSNLEIVKCLLVKAFDNSVYMYNICTDNETFKKNSLDKLFQIFTQFGGLTNPNFKSDVVVEYYTLFLSVTYYNVKHVGPKIIEYSINPEDPEKFLKVMSEKWLCGDILYQDTYFSRPPLEGPAAIEYFTFGTELYYKSYKFYAEEDIITGPITDEPAISCTTYDDIEYNIYVVDGYPHMMTCKNSHICRIDFCPNTGQKLTGSLIESLMNKYMNRYTLKLNNKIACSRGFISSSIQRIIWTDGTIYTFLDEEHYIKEVVDSSKEWFKMQDNTNKFWKFPLDPDMGIPHRCEFALDETGSEVLLPAKMFLANPELNTYWVNGKQVNEDWFPKKARSKPIKKYQKPKM